jgi:hypothetical protein
MRTGKKVKMDRLGTILLLSLMSTVTPVSAAPVAEYASGSNQMVRTELYFGAIARSQWDGFLKQVVTPLFPEGLTWFDVQGQWRAPDGVTRKLPSQCSLFCMRIAGETTKRLNRFAGSSKINFITSPCCGFQ